MKLIAYIRVSTDRQAESGLGLEAQIAQCEAYAKSIGAEISQVFTDGGISGGKCLEERPVLGEAINTLRKGDLLLVAKRDRLGRDVAFVSLIEKAIKKRKASLISASNEGTFGDENDPSNLMVRRMTDVFSELEKATGSWRTRKALQAKKVKGERVGHIPFGYRLADDGVRLEKDEAEQEILRQMSELRALGLSIRKIADELNKRGAFNRGESKWNNASTHRILGSMEMAA